MTQTAECAAVCLRERIIEEATRLFAEKGYHSVSVRELVEACACTKPVLYYYFGSKEELYRQVVRIQFAAMEQLIADWGAAVGDFRQRTHRAVDALIAFAQHNGQAIALLRKAEMVSDGEAPQVDVKAYRDVHMGMVADIVARGIKAGEIRSDIDPIDCSLLLAGMLQFQVECSLASGLWEPERFHRTLELLFDGIS